MHVHVDETRHHDVTTQIDSGGFTHCTLRTYRTYRTYRTRCTYCTYCTYSFPVDHEGALRLDTFGQDEIGAGQNDHER
jgi:hypothetical protein